jgi:hypothetical protein
MECSNILLIIMDWLKVGKSFGSVEKKRDKKSKNKIIAVAVNDP